MDDILRGSLAFKGERGYSAYEVAVQNGFEGTVEEWLALLGVSDEVKKMLQGLASGSPFVATSTSGMTDKTHVYVNTTDGNWYYYNGSTWAIGGVYQSTGIADNSVSTDKTDFIKKLNLIDVNDYKIIDDTRHFTAKISHLNLINVVFRSDLGALIDFKNSDGTYTTPGWFGAKVVNTIKVPSGVVEIRLRYVEADISALHYVTVMSEEDYNKYGDVGFNELYCELYELEKVKDEVEIINDNISKIINDFKKVYQESSLVEWTEGFYFSANGILTADNTYKVSNYIPVSYGDKFKIDGGCEYNTRIYLLCDEYQNVISAYPTESKTYNYREIVEFTIPEKVAYMRLCSPTRYETILYELEKYNAINVDQLENNVLNNKTILFTGDSICYGAGERPEVEDWKDTGWVKRIRENNPLSSVHGYGLGGTTITKRENMTNSILERLDKMYSEHPEADYLIIQGGVNDAYCYETVPLGEISEGYNAKLDEYTFSGALESLFKKAQLQWQGKKIGFIATFKIPSAIYLNEYMERAKEICKKYSVPYLDLFNSSGLNYHLDEIRANYSDNNDGCHPNYNGYEVISPTIEKWIKSL